MRKLKLLGVMLLALAFGVVNVKAEDTLQEKIDAANVGDIIKLDKDYTEDIIVGENKEITLDLNGHILTTWIRVDKGDLTVSDSNNGGKIVNRAYSIEVSNGSFTLKNGTIESNNNYAIYGLDDSLITIDGGNIKAGDYACLGSNNTTGNATFVINGGILSANWQTIYVANPVGITINGGTLNGGLSVRMGVININGGTINATVADASQYDHIEDYYDYRNGFPWFADAIYAMAGTYTTTSEEGNKLEINIKGGTINALNGLGSALAIYDIGYVEQDIRVNISGNAVLNSNATERNAYDVLSLEDVGVTNPKAGYGVYSGNVETTLIGGVYTEEPAPEMVSDGYDVYEVIGGDNDGKYVVAKEEDLEITTEVDELNKEDIEDEIAGYLDAYEKAKNGEIEYDEEDMEFFEFVKEFKDTVDKYNVIGYYEIYAMKVTEDNDVVDFANETKEPVEVKLVLPEDLPEVKEGLTRKYYVIRVHDGEVTVIDDVTVNDDGTVSFKSDKFSTYVLAYEDVAKETPKEDVKPADTFDGGIVSYVAIMLVMLGMITYVSLYLKKRFN